MKFNFFERIVEFVNSGLTNLDKKTEQIVKEGLGNKAYKKLVYFKYFVYGISVYLILFLIKRSFEYLYEVKTSLSEMIFYPIFQIYDMYKDIVKFFKRMKSTSIKSIKLKNIKKYINDFFKRAYRYLKREISYLYRRYKESNQEYKLNESITLFDIKNTFKNVVSYLTQDFYRTTKAIVHDIGNTPSNELPDEIKLGLINIVEKHEKELKAKMNKK